MIHASLKLRITTIVALLSFLTLTMVPTNAVAQSARHEHRTASSFVQGTDGNGNAFSGIVTITSFATQGNQLVANGVVNGTLTSSDGTATPIVGQAVTLPVSGIDPNCQILNLVLGPLDLNLLGLTVHLNQVVLNITAVPGAGNLLGNLLCAVANLLNGNGAVSTLLTQLTTLLNQILAAL
jgi:hypothetical protein